MSKNNLFYHSGKISEKRNWCNMAMLDLLIISGKVDNSAHATVISVLFIYLWNMIIYVILNF